MAIITKRKIKRQGAVSPAEARRYLRTIADSSAHFYAHDGTRLANLFDLYAFLKVCSDETFRHHVDGSKNDFSKWISDVILDKELADDLGNCLSRLPMQVRLIKRINSLVANSTKQLYGVRKAQELLSTMKAAEEAFVASDGRWITNLWELYEFLRTADQSSFEKHVNDSKNDIATWVDDILCDWELADRISGVKDKEEMAALVGLRLKTLENRVALEAKFKNKQQPGSYLKEVLRKLE